MEFVVCAVIGYVLALLVHGWLPKHKPMNEPTDEEKRRAGKAMREYENFMNYDGFPSDE